MNHKKWKRQGSMVKFKYTWKAYKIKSKNIFFYYVNIVEIT